MRFTFSRIVLTLSLLLTNAIQASDLLPVHVFSRGVEKATAVLVDKNAQVAHLVQMENDEPISIRQYTDLMFGENNGPKEHEGDKRTPEGVYRITSFLPDWDLDVRYGAGAFPLNYPNPIDRIEGRDGSGIWLHGRDDADLTKDVTRGCVAFNNQDIVELQPLIGKSADVVLAQNIDFAPAETYQVERRRLLKVLDDFVGAWETGDFDAMGAMLHPQFTTAKGQSGKAWLNRKKSIHKAIRQRTIEVDNVSVMRESNDQVVYEFVQSYCARNISTRGVKRLFFKQDQDQLKLMTERFSPLQPVSIDKNKVLAFINGWLKAWNDGDLDRYIHQYDRDFKDAKGRGLGAYRNYKKGIFADRPDQLVEVRELSIRTIRANKFRVSFDQKYTSKAYSDMGRKELVINACAGKMAIESETWRKL